MSRTIFIKAQGNKRPTKVTDFTGTTFGDLKAHVTEINFDNASVMIHATRTTLHDDDSMIPAEGEVILLVVPKEMKAGADYADMKRNELMTAVRGFIDNNGDDAMVYFGNYPQMRSDAVIGLLNNYNPTAPEEEVALADLPEYSNLVASYQEVAEGVTKLNGVIEALGEIINQQPEEVYGGMTESALDNEFKALSGTN